jgi:hypothetical protein
VTWRTNRKISDKDPERYLAERRDKSELGEEELRTRLASHFIPYEEMITGDYHTFLEKRAALIHWAITRVCTGGSD